jgi:hypothetical protein
VNTSTTGAAQAGPTEGANAAVVATATVAGNCGQRDEAFNDGPEFALWEELESASAQW